MYTKRKFVLGLGAMAIVPIAPAMAHRKFKLDPQYEPQSVKFSDYASETIIVDPRNHFLYLQLGGSRARRNGVGVGRAGLAFRRSATIGRKAKWPRLTPTQNMIRREPQKYAKYAGGVPCAPGNPLGARALYIFQGNADTLYRIHGSPEYWAIGKAVSSGSVRLMNQDIIDLYRRVPKGSTLIET